MLSAPAFWWRNKGSWQAAGLYLPSLVYAYFAGRNMLRKPRSQSRLPVLCIGNFVLGGTGKTPFALCLAERLMEEGFEPGFLLRGYGGQLKGPVHVNLDRHDAQMVGDEALLLADLAPTVVSADRGAGARLAEDLGIDILLMDDGFQNPVLKKDLSFALIDAQSGLGNGMCLPAGPLRAPMAAQILKADALVVVGTGDNADTTLHLAGRRGLPIFRAAIVPEAGEDLDGRELYAFAGIGRPEKFFKTLGHLGLNVVRRKSFPDHYTYRAKDAGDLLKTAEAEDLQLVTTEKDMARLRTAQSEIFRWLSARSAVLPVNMVIEEEDRLIGLVREMIRTRAFDSRK